MIRVRTTSRGVHTVSATSAAREPHTQAVTPLTAVPEREREREEENGRE